MLNAQKRLLIVCSRNLRIVEPLRSAFVKYDIAVDWFDTHSNHWFDRYVIHRINKLAHNLRIVSKKRVFFQEHPLSHFNYRNSQLLKRIEADLPDFVLMVRGLRFSKETLSSIASRSTLVGWYVESENLANQVFEEVDFFNKYFFISPGSVELFRSHGFSNVDLMRHSVDVQAYHPIAVEKRFDWCFVGNWSKTRQELIEAAIQISPGGAVYGPNWHKHNISNYKVMRTLRGKYIYGEDLARLYSATKVILNATAWGNQSGEQRTGVNMRILEVPACRAALLTDVSEDLSEIVSPGIHVITYDSPREFREKLALYISNDAEREEIASSGYDHVTSHYSYDDTAKRLLKAFRRN